MLTSCLLGLLWVGLADGPVSEHAAATPPVVSVPPVVIYRDPSRYDSFPDLERLGDGRILCVFRDARYPKRVRHIDADARVVGCLSKDGGLSWGGPSVIYDDPACQQDPSVARLRDGRLALNFFTWVGVSAESLATRPSPSARKVGYEGWGEYAQLGGVYILWGRDKPLGWEEKLVQVSPGGTVSRATSASMVQTHDGVLLLPTYGADRKEEKSRAYVMRSTDDGRSWNELLVASDAAGKIDFEEPCLIENRDGEIIAVMRTAGAEDHLYLVRSLDKGLKWSEPQRLAIVGHPADLLRLPDGRIMMAYGYRHPPFGVRVCVSMDYGKTWDLRNEIVVTDTGAQGDLGYPSLCRADEGHVLVAYYMNGTGTKDRWIECKRIPLRSIPQAR